MARRKRRRKPPLLGTVPGQRGRLVIEPSKLVVERQPDKVILHDRGGGTQTRTIPGREHHVHIHPQAARQRPERPVFDFGIMAKQLAERVQSRIEQRQINLSVLKEPEFESRWRGKEGIIRGVFDIRKILNNKWLVMHPLQLLGKMTTRKLGRPGFKKGSREYNKALKLRENYAPRAERIYFKFRNEAQAALEKLRMDVEAGRVTWEYRNFYVGEFEKAVKEAENRFQISRKKLMDDYAVEWKKK